MPLFQLVDEDGKVHQVRRMDHAVMKHLNETREDGKIWRRGLQLKGHRAQPKSLISVLRVLDCEGVTEHELNSVLRWYRYSRKHAGQRAAKDERLYNRFRRFMRNQSDQDRATVGKFVSLQARASLESGLRMGLAVALARQPEFWEYGDDGTKQS